MASPCFPLLCYMRTPTSNEEANARRQIAFITRRTHLRNGALGRRARTRSAGVHRLARRCSGRDKVVALQECEVRTEDVVPSVRFHDGWVMGFPACDCLDEDGGMWMTYGSWFGGIWMLRLDPATGLRDYTADYFTKHDASDATTGPT